MDIVRNILAVILGFMAGNIVNMLIITAGHAIMPPPPGFNPQDVVSTIHFLQPIDYIVPFLAHAIGPLVGVFIAMYVAASSRNTIAIILGGLFLAAGIAANIWIPAPMWYRAVDLLFAYVPMAYFGYKLSGRS